MKDIIKVNNKQQAYIKAHLKDKLERNKFIIMESFLEEGDILVCVDSSNCVSQYFIYKRGTNISEDFVEVYYGLDLNDRVDNKDFNGCCIFYDRKATDDEVLDFHRILRDNGYYWDEKEKELKEL